MSRLQLPANPSHPQLAQQQSITPTPPPLTPKKVTPHSNHLQNYLMQSPQSNRQFNIVNRIHNGVTIQLNKNTSNQINNISPNQSANVRNTNLLPPPSLPNIPINLAAVSSPLSTNSSNLATTQFVFDNNAITPTLLHMPMVNVNAQNMQNLALNQQMVNQMQLQSKVNKTQNNVNNNNSPKRLHARNHQPHSRNYQRKINRNHHQNHRHSNKNNNNYNRNNHSNQRNKRYNQNNNHRKHRKNHFDQQHNVNHVNQNVNDGANDDSKVEQKEEEKNRHQNEAHDQQEKNVWCPYYQYGCRAFFPESQRENHLRSAYREHLIIQLAEVYKLINLIMSTISSFPTFDELRQEPPLNTNNKNVSNALQYLSQHNAHLVSILTQQQQNNNQTVQTMSTQQTQQPQSKPNSKHNRAEKQQKGKVITEEMEQFASNLRLPRPQLPSKNAMENRKNIPKMPIKSCPIDRYPYIVSINGRNGFNAEINGDYYLLPTLHQNRPCYKKLSTSWCIRWNEATTEWFIDCDGLNHDNNSCARVQQDVVHPGLIRNAWRVYSNPRHLKDDNVKASVTANLRSEAAAYCKSKHIAWPPFTESDIEKILNNNQYDTIRHSSHSRQNSVANSVNNSNQEENNNVNIDVTDEELQQQRQRHQDQYLESMPTSHYQNKAGIIISTVSVSVSHQNNDDMKEISPSPSQYSITSETQSMSVSQSILEKTIVESQEPSTSHLVPVHEDNIHPAMSANLSFSNVSNKAVKLEMSLDHRNSVSASLEQEVEEDNEPETKPNNVRRPPLKNNNFTDRMSQHYADLNARNKQSPSKAARRKKRRNHKKSSCK